MNNEKTYKLMGRVGGGTLALGIIVLVTGVVTGILTIVNGDRSCGRHYFHCQWSAAFKTQIRN